MPIQPSKHLTVAAALKRNNKLSARKLGCYWVTSLVYLVPLHLFGFTKPKSCLADAEPALNFHPAPISYVHNHFTLPAIIVCKKEGLQRGVESQDVEIHAAERPSGVLLQGVPHGHAVDGPTGVTSS